MKSTMRKISVVALGLLAAVPAFGVASIPVRGSSRNGENSSAQFWNLLGPTQVLNTSKGTTSLTYKYQVVCPTQQVTAAVNPTDEFDNGACADDNYMFVFQLNSTGTNVNVQLGGLGGFTADATDPDNATYGVMLCDSSANTLELCTKATQSQLPAITFTSTATTATFSIANFPVFPPGKNHQGQGLTIFIMTHQNAPHPVYVPRLSLK